MAPRNNWVRTGTRKLLEVSVERGFLSLPGARKNTHTDTHLEEERKNEKNRKKKNENQKILVYVCRLGGV